jgi:Uma2 family endonuclease
MWYLGDELIYGDYAMAEHVAHQKAITDTTPTKISAEEYLDKYAELFYEWVDGVLIMPSPATLKHNDLIFYLSVLLNAYFRLNSIGRVAQSPFLMEVEATNSKREPDLMVILNTNPGQLTETKMIGPADICIEIVSPGSTERDYGEKFSEYEKGGVKEYWLLDSLRREAHFYRLGEDGLYQSQLLDAQGNYRTPMLPNFALHVPILWQTRLPFPDEIVEAVKRMVTLES